jgi:serine/threonine-protein kinase
MTIGDALAPGARIDDYEIRCELASGGFGTVYLAEHLVLGRRAAIKVLHVEAAASPELVARFVREARSVNMIRHRNIVDIYEFGELSDRRPYLVMEYLEGQTLEGWMKEHGRMSAREALPILEPLCAALAAAHAAGYVHRDLKTSNVMVLPSGDVKLLDFGIAKLVDQRDGQPILTARGERIGSVHAMSPEQFRGDPVDARADVYALGVLVFQLLTGRMPFLGPDPTSFERQHLEEPPPPPSRFTSSSPALDAVVLRCLAKAAVDRFASIDDFLAALRSAAGLAESGAASSTRSTTGVALFVSADFDPMTTDDQVDQAAAFLAESAVRLRSLGYEIASLTTDSLLAVREVPRASFEPVSVQTRQLARSLAERTPVPLSQIVSAGPMIVAVDGKPLEGPLLSPQSWPEPRRIDGIGVCGELLP